jgi:hypothetical protein
MPRPDIALANDAPEYIARLADQTGLKRDDCARRIGISPRALRNYTSAGAVQRAPYSVQFALEQLAADVDEPRAPVPVPPVPVPAAPRPPMPPARPAKMTGADLLETLETRVTFDELATMSDAQIMKLDKVFEEWRWRLETERVARITRKR